MSWVLTHTDSEDELRAQFRGLRQRFDLNGWTPGGVYYVDKGCCRQDGRLSAFQEEFNADCTSKLDAMHFLGRCAKSCGETCCV